MSHPLRDNVGDPRGRLEDQVSLLPTPLARDSKGTSHPDRRRELNPKRTPMLNETAVHLLPTPTAAAYGNNQSPSPGAAVRPSLNSLAPTLLPTPTATNANGNQYNNQGKRLLPGIAVDLIGLATAPPSIDGRPSSDVPPPLQLWSVPAAEGS